MFLVLLLVLVFILVVLILVLVLEHLFIDSIVVHRTL